MNYRLNKNVLVVVAILVLVAVGLFVYTLVSAPNAQEEATTTAATAPVHIPQHTPDTIINAKEQYVDGTHTIAGKITVPTPCHSVSVEPFFLDNSSSTVELRFTTVLQGDQCPAVPSDTTFKVSFNAPENATITAVWDGDPVRLNLVPVQPGESLDEEFYFKG